MSVGNQAITCFQGEDVSWNFTYTDSSAPSITGWAVRGVIKVSAAATSTLIGPIVCTINDGTHFTFAANINVSPGSYVYSMRRTDAGFSWELATGTLTVLDSPSIN